MAFRADEAAAREFENLKTYFASSRNLDEPQRKRAIEELSEIVFEYGPVVESYPTWHPLVSNHDSCDDPITHPGRSCGYRGLDHTRYFANAFITCPYGDGQEVIDSVNELPSHPLAIFSAERLDFQLYHPNATPVLVKCHWQKHFEGDRTIPLSIAMPLLLEKELPCWRNAQVAETWETMRPYFLGRPHGSRSSLFVNQETGQGIKKVWNAVIYTGMYGPIKI
ncbi:hypothetical protein [Halomonas stenophila]|uniref:Uncharacterized protein n=1 Tax=Halomonas stenophila TaxID=795312 RepID=A0A7W5ETC9_9GAMM|nr:hypothetical protein [Halomonas stenophila]MBB3230961.1 hypothetical protein [Halomonas stenophila]